MMTGSKITFHISDDRRGDITWDAPARAQVRVLKLFGAHMESEMHLQRFISVLPADCLIVFRPNYPWDDHDPNQLTPDLAMETIDRLLAKQGWPKGLVWEGLCEWNPRSEAEFRALDAWYTRFGQLLHARGEKAAAFSFSEGNPNPPLLPHLALCANALAACDFVALHEYHRCFTYYRQIWAALPVKKPILITETGYDANGDNVTGGWLAHPEITPEIYLRMLADYDAQLMQDPYVLGATVYQLGDPYAWKSFEIVKIVEPLASYIAGQGGGYPPVYDVTPPPPPPPAKLTDVEIAELVVKAGFADPVTGVAVVLAESGGDPAKKNTAGNTPPSTDRGLWQINDYWHGPNVEPPTVAVTDACAYDAVCSTNAAKEISRGGSDYSQWSAFNAGSHAQFLARAQAAVTTARANVQPIVELTADKTTVAPGGTVVVSWHIENIRAAYLVRSGSPVEIGLPGPRGTRDFVLYETTTYFLRVILLDGTERRSEPVEVVVTSGPDVLAAIRAQALELRAHLDAIIELAGG